MLVQAALAAAFVLLGLGALRGVDWGRLGLWLAASASACLALLWAEGTPRPLWTIPGGLPGPLTVVASSLDRPRAIYLWVADGGPAPLSVELPWSDRAAAQLEAAAAAASAAHGRVQVRFGRRGHGRARESPEFTAENTPLPPKAH